MKKSLANIKIILILLLLMATTAVFGFAATQGASAFAFDGEDEIAPTEIGSYGDLLALAEFVNGKNSTADRRYVLTSDIVLGNGFTAIGTSDSPFNGTFDGRGHSVEVDLQSDVNNLGFFGVIGNRGTVKNLEIKGSVLGANYVGGVAGLNYGRIESCLNSASVGVKTYGGSDCGGIAGSNYGAIAECVNAGAVTGHIRGGGIVGRGSQTSVLEGCVNFGLIQTVAATGGSAVGGILGESAGYIADSYNFAQLDTKSERTGSVVGSLTGFAEGSEGLYNISEGSARATVGYPESAADTFESVSYYRLLAGDELFTKDKLFQADYDTGYGYLPSPRFILAYGFTDLFKLCLFGDGDGTADNPFVINNAEEWSLFSVNSEESDYEGVFLTVKGDLDLGGVKPAFCNTEFKGYFDGRGSLLAFSAESDGICGLFGRIGESGTVTDVVLNGAVTSTTASCAGILAAESAGTVTDVITNGTVSSESYTGGIIGKITGGTVSECENYALVSGVQYVGGIAGSSVAANVDLLNNFGKVGILSGHSYAYSHIGGLFGEITATTIARLFNSGEVSAYKADYVGGIAGRFSGSTVETSVNLGNVSGRRRVGGLIGFISNVSAQISDTAVIATVSGAVSVGGLNGENGGMLSVERSYFYGGMGEVAEATVDKSKFFAVAPTTVDNDEVYYCSDFLYDSYADKQNADGKSAVEFTQTVFDDEGWKEEPKELSYGYLPIPVETVTDTTEDIILLKVRYDYFGGGDGEAEPYKIATEQHLRNASYLINNYSDYRALSYVQTANIEVKRAFEAIGKEGFDGIYDGNGYTISDAVLTDGYLFGTLNGEIIGVAVESGASDKSGLVGTVSENGKITASYSLVYVTGSFAGGLCITNYGEITASFYSGRIIGAAGSVVGGIAAENYAVIKNCFSSAYLSGTTVGGIAGRARKDANSASAIDGCAVSGTVNGLSGTNVKIGGFAGESIGNVTFTDSFITAVITVGGEAPEDGVYAGALVGYADGFLNFDQYNVKYNSDYASVHAAYYAAGTLQTAALYGVTANAMWDETFDNAFNDKFAFAKDGDMDSEYAPKNLAFVNTGSERVEYLSSEAVKIRLFGWDNASEAVWGNKDNPYLISSVSQLTILGERVDLGYSYNGCYFELKNDLDFTNEIFRPIGRYVKPSDANNRIFNGVFDGNGHTLRNLHLQEPAAYGYVALFAYAGGNVEIKNLILDETCTITGANGTASIVGFNSGVISHCISYATVTGKDVGGIAAVSSSGTKITDCVFIGHIAGDNNAYGIISQDAQGLVIDMTDSWFVVKNDDASYVETGRESYQHNGYGSVIYEDRRGSLNVRYTLDGFVFVLTAESGYTAKILNTADGVVYDETKHGEYYDPKTNQDVVSGAAVRYYARFTLPLEASFLSNGDKVLNAAGYGSGNYYEGQNVKFTFSIADGYFIDGNDYYDEHGFAYANEGDRVVFNFAAPALNGAEKAEIPVNIVALSDFAEITFDGGVYTGEKKDPIIEGDYEEQLEFSVAIYFGEDAATQISVAEVNAAGSYTVKFRIIRKGGRSFMGTATKQVSVERAVLSVVDEADWAAVASKEYDGAVSSKVSIPATYYTGVIDKDKSGVNLTATVTWNDAKAAETKTATVGDFTITGAAANNYRITAATKTTDSAKIWAKTVAVGITEDKLSGEYGGDISPVIDFSGIVLDGDARITTEFILLKDDGSEDGNWDRQSWNVGKYKLKIGCSDKVNYNVTTASAEGYYVYTIVPKPVDKVVYSGFNGLEYTGEAITGMNGIYDTLTGKDGVKFEFRYLLTDQVVNEIVNAGYYVAYPIIENKNYVLTGTVNPCEFSVMRAKSDLKLSLSWGDGGAVPTSIEANVEYPITVSGRQADASDDPILRIKLAPASSARMEIRYRDGQYYIIATKYAKHAEFQIYTSDSVNFEDRESETYTLTVTPQIIYYAISEESRHLVFGDVPNVEIIYSFDENFKEKLVYDSENGTLTDLDGNEIAGFSAPKPTPFNVEEIRGGESIVANFYGGSGDAYELKQNFELSNISVSPREIIIYVSSEDLTPKLYGDDDPVIGYAVRDGANGRMLTELPDGRPVKLNGELSRAAGEKVGSYDILCGTLTTENNADYAILYDFSVQFKINKRTLKIQIDAVSKEYGSAEQPITYRLVDGTEFAYDENVSNIRFEIVRAEGEEIGEYDYIVNYSESDNYVIVVDSTTNKYSITKARPTINFAVSGTLNYGDAVNKLSLTGNAYSNGRVVIGRFEWTDGKSAVDGVGYKTLNFEFIPSSSNYSVVSDIYVAEVKPREAVISYEGALEYVYNGSRQCDIKASVLNAVGDDEVKLTTEVVGNPVNAGTYKMKVKINDDKYVIAEGYEEIQFSIYKAIVTVSVESAVVKEGDAYSPKIVYEGFVGGESASSLKKRATVSGYDLSGGYYTLIPSGAESDNYEFNYLSGTLTVNKTSVSSNGITLNGDMGATVKLEVGIADDSGLKRNSKVLDKALKYNAIMPNPQKMKAYYALEFSTQIDGEYTYFAELALSDGDKIYAVAADGTVTEITEYEIVDTQARAADGDDRATVVVTFTAQALAGIAVYTDKSIAETVKSYLPLAAVCFAALFVVSAVIAILVQVRKKDKKREKYLKKYGK